jgi:hypothetical protein
VAAENDALSASVPSVVRRTGMGLSPWLAVLLVLAAGGGSGYLGAWLGGDALRAAPSLPARPSRRNASPPAASSCSTRKR